MEKERRRQLKQKITKRRNFSGSGGSGEMVGDGSDGCDGGSIGSKKRLRLNGKVDGNCYAVVPRKLRSAISKRSGEAGSFTVANGQRKDNHLRTRENRLLTKDEEDVVEVLSTLADIAKLEQPMDGNSDVKMITSMISRQATKAESIKLPSTSSAAKSADASHQMNETSGEIKGANSKVKSGMANIDQLRSAAQANGRASMNNEHLFTGVTNMNTSSQSEKSFHSLPSNHEVQFMQLEATPLKPGITSLNLMHASPVIWQETNSLYGKNHTHKEMWNAASTTGASADLTGSFPSKPPEPISSCLAQKPGPGGNCLSMFTGKALLGSASIRGPWRKGAKHVHISNFIRNYQSKEKTVQSRYQNEAYEGTESATSAGRGSTLRTSGPESPSLTGNKCRDSTTRALNGMPVCLNLDQTTVYENKTQTKQTHDFLSSASCETTIPGTTKKFSGKPPTNFLQTLPHPQLVPLSLPPGQHPSTYSEQFAVHQLPNYVFHPIYELSMGRATGATSQQQQLMWQAHYAHYRQPHTIPLYQNGRPQDPSLIPSSSTTDTLVGLHPNPHFHQQILPITFPSSAKKQQQQLYGQPGSYEGGMLQPEGPVQLQLLCKVRHT